MLPQNFAEQNQQASRAERALIGCVLARPEVLDDCTHIREQDFREAPHRILWTALLAMYAEPTPIDPLTLYDRVVRACPNNSFPGEGGLPAVLIAQAIQECTSPSLAFHYASILRDLSLLRAIAHAGHQISQEAESPTGPASEVLHTAERAIFALAEFGLAGGAVPLSQALRESLERLGARIDNPQSTGVATGIAPLDNLTGGLKPGELIVLAARPSVGKTGLALAIAADAARDGQTGLFCSIEMDRAELARRLLLSALPPGFAVTPEHIRRDPQSIGPKAFADLTDIGHRLGSLPLWIDDSASQDVLRVAANARRLKRRHGLALVVVDYLQLVEPDDRRTPRHEQVGAISRRLKQLARELCVPLIALAQLNREVEARTDKKPKLSDLRESGQVEQDADVVLLLHRTEEGNPGQPVPLCVQVAKNRNGPCGEFVVSFDRDRMRFSEPSVFST